MLNSDFFERVSQGQPPVKRGHIRPTRQRGWAFPDHFPPSGRGERKNKAALEAGKGDERRHGRGDTFGGRWPGTSHEHDPARRRRENKASYVKAKREEFQYADTAAILDEILNPKD